MRRQIKPYGCFINLCFISPTSKDEKRKNLTGISKACGGRIEIKMALLKAIIYVGKGTSRHIIYVGKGTSSHNLLIKMLRLKHQMVRTIS